MRSRRASHGSVRPLNCGVRRHVERCARIVSSGSNGTRIGAENVRAADCPLGGRLQRRRGGSLGCWFRLRKPLSAVLLSGAINYRPEQVADEVIGVFQELEAWWESKVVGPHVHMFR